MLLRCKLFSLLLVLCFSSNSLVAHEYWLSPIKYEVSVGEKLIVDIRNGDDFTGSGLPFIPERVRTVFGVGSGGKIPLESRMGDYPAIHRLMERPGLFMVVFSSTEKLITYPAQRKFIEFIEYHGLQRELADLELEELPQANLKEHYYRFAKTLTLVNSKAEIDASDTVEDSHVLKPAGQLFEIVLLNNPHAENTRFRLQLLYRGEPLADRQVEVFIKNNSVNRIITQTNESGIAEIDTSVTGEYLINAVHLLPPGRDTLHVQTLWTSLTFERR